MAGSWQVIKADIHITTHQGVSLPHTSNADLTPHYREINYIEYNKNKFKKNKKINKKTHHDDRQQRMVENE